MPDEQAVLKLLADAHDALSFAAAELAVAAAIAARLRPGLASDAGVIAVAVDREVEVLTAVLARERASRSV